MSRSRLVSMRRWPGLPHLSAGVWRFLATLRRHRRRRWLLKTRFFRRPLARLARQGWAPRKLLIREGQIPASFVGQTLRIHRGARWRRLYVQRFNVGLMWGSFARTQALAVFKKKAGAKKQRKRQKHDAQATLTFKQRRLRMMQEGTYRRAAVQLEPKVEALLRGVGL